MSLPFARESIPHSNHRLIIDALADYAQKTGVNLANNPFADKFQLSQSPDDILKLLEERELAFKQYRGKNRTLISCFKPAVNVLHAFSAPLKSLVSLARLVPLLICVLILESNSPGAVPTSKSYLCRCRCPPRSKSLKYRL
jgi:hypothetical protein